MNYSVLRTNGVGEKTVIYQTNSYTEANRVANYFNENREDYGFAHDNYEIVTTDYTQIKIIEKIIK